jgi:hypothetical protein
MFKWRLDLIITSYLPESTPFIVVGRGGSWWVDRGGDVIGGGMFIEWMFIDVYLGGDVYRGGDVSHGRNVDRDGDVESSEKSHSQESNHYV